MKQKNQLELNLIKEEIASFSTFSLGKQAVGEMEPNYSRLIVNRDLKRIRQALAAVVFNGGYSFSGLKDIRHACEKANKEATLSIQEIVDVGLFIRGCQKILRETEALETEHDSLDDLIDSLVIDEAIAKEIEKCMSVNYEVLDQASAKLATIRRQIKEISKRISTDMQAFINRNKDSLTQTVATSRHQRSVVMVKPSDKNKISGMVHGESATGQTVYIEPEFMVRLNNELQRLVQEEADEIERICRALTLMIGSSAQQLEANLDTAVILDVLFAKAKWGHYHEGVVASLSDDRLEIIAGRHPLIEPHKVVANSYHCIPPHRMIIITGPNTGGKSVALKTMGLFTLLTLCGCPVLAESAIVPMVDDIFVDIGDQQSITQSLSTFSGHLSNIASITRQCTSQSMVLLDELGGGTDPQEGESLAIAILDYLREMGAFVVATTHYSGLKTYASQHPEILSASVGFDIDTLQPTYQYIENVTGSSYAFEIAARLDIDPIIIEHAKTIKEELRSEQDRLMETLEQKLTQENQQLDFLEQERIVLRAQAKELQQQQYLLEQSKEREIEKAKEEARRYLELLETEANEIIVSLKQASKPHEYTEAIRKLNSLRPVDSEPVVRENGPIQVGDSVKIRQSGQVGIVESIEKNQVIVHIGNLTVRAKLKDCVKVSVPKPKKKIATKSYSVKALSRPSLECNVIGQHVDEALQSVAKYLDDCVVHHLSTVRIVHGHGTGALREAIHDFLRRNRKVKSFRLGGQGEGGVGATVVTLKDE